MSNAFLTIINMSLTGAFVITSICFARLFLRKAPKIISYCLWAVAGFRLIFPFSIESALSLMPFASQSLTRSVAVNNIEQTGIGVSLAAGDTINIAAQHSSAELSQILLTIGIRQHDEILGARA